MKQCENNPELVKRLVDIYKAEQNEQEDKEYTIYHEIMSRYDDIKLVLFSLNNCVKTNIDIGEKRRIDINSLFNEVNSLSKEGDILLESKHERHKDFLYIINTITREIYGEDFTYRIDKDESIFSNYLMLKDVTLGELWKYRKDYFIVNLIGCLISGCLVSFGLFIISLESDYEIYYKTIGVLVCVIYTKTFVNDYKFSLKVREF